MAPALPLPEIALRERALRLDARKLAVETLVRVHLDSVAGTRQLMLGHQRLMFTLSLGALAGVITLFAAGLRLGAAQTLPLPPLAAGLALLALAALTASALISAAALQKAARHAAGLLRDPFPGAGDDLELLFSDEQASETVLVSRMLDVLAQRARAEPVVAPRASWTTFLLLVGAVATAAAFTV